MSRDPFIGVGQDEEVACRADVLDLRLLTGNKGKADGAVVCHGAGGFFDGEIVVVSSLAHP